MIKCMMINPTSVLAILFSKKPWVQFACRKLSGVVNVVDATQQDTVNNLRMPLFRGPKRILEK